VFRPGVLSSSIQRHSGERSRASGVASPIEQNRARFRSGSSSGRAAEELADHLGLPLVVVDPNGIWNPAWGELYRSMIMEATTVHPQLPRGPKRMPITPKTESLFRTAICRNKARTSLIFNRGT
jgi:hypothetical protein